MQLLMKEIYESILNGQQAVTAAKVTEVLETKVGRLFEEVEYFVPEMLIAARAMRSGLAVLNPRLALAKSLVSE